MLPVRSQLRHVSRASPGDRCSCASGSLAIDGARGPTPEAATRPTSRAGRRAARLGEVGVEAGRQRWSRSAAKAAGAVDRDHGDVPKRRRSRSLRVASIPSMTGRRRSMSTRSGGSTSAFSMHAMPLSATATGNQGLQQALSTSRFSASSSVTRMRNSCPASVRRKPVMRVATIALPAGAAPPPPRSPGTRTETAACPWRALDREGAAHALDEPLVMASPNPVPWLRLSPAPICWNGSKIRPMLSAGMPNAGIRPPPGPTGQASKPKRSVTDPARGVT